MARPGAGPLWRDDRGEMVLVMFGITVVLLGVAGVLVHLLGRPPATEPVTAGRQVALSAAVAVRAEALRAGLSSTELDDLDVAGSCARGAGAGAEVVSCELTPAGLTVVTARAERPAARNGQAFSSAVVRFVDTAGGCLALRTSWGTGLPATCPAGR